MVRNQAVIDGCEGVGFAPLAVTRTLPIALTLALLAGCDGWSPDQPLVKITVEWWGLGFAIVFFAALAVMLLRLVRRIPPNEVDLDEMMREANFQKGHPFGLTEPPRLHVRLWRGFRRRTKKAKSESDWSRF